jgi:hypothetical protein
VAEKVDRTPGERRGEQGEITSVGGAAELCVDADPERVVESRRAVPLQAIAEALDQFQPRPLRDLYDLRHTVIHACERVRGRPLSAMTQ